MFASVVFDLVWHYLAKRLAGKNVSEMTYLCWVGWKNLTQSINIFHVLFIWSCLRLVWAQSSFRWPAN